MKKNLKKKKNPLGLILDNDRQFHISSNVTVDDDGIAIKYVDLTSPKYDKPNHFASGKKTVLLTWDNISDIDKKDIIKLFKLTDKLISRLKP